MRTGAVWHEVCIVNLSSRGLGIQAADPPLRGTYVEICRGRHVIVARVMWTKGHRAGLQSQDLIFVQGLIHEAITAKPEPRYDGARPVERRHRARTAAQRHEDSRIAARAAEFAFIAFLGIGMGVLGLGVIEQALAQPLAEIRAALGSG